MLIDLGGGTLPHPRADYVIDLHHPKGSPAQNAAVTPWTVGGRLSLFALSDNAADEIYSSHFMEHVPKGQPIINVMNEAWRVLKPGGTYTMIFPIIGYTNPEPPYQPLSDHIGWQPWADPTHVQYWWMPESLLYFTGGAWSAHADYGIKNWEFGGFVPEAIATEEINLFMATPAKNLATFWSIRSGWEAVARMRKP